MFVDRNTGCSVRISLRTHVCAPRWILCKHECVNMSLDIFMCVALSQSLELSGVQIFSPHTQRGGIREKTT